MSVATIIELYGEPDDRGIIWIPEPVAREICKTHLVYVAGYRSNPWEWGIGGLA